MSEDTPTAPETDELAVYLIRKHGLWYRPDERGYTSSATQAGRYTLAYAEKITHPNGKDGPRDAMDYVHEDAVNDADWLVVRAIRAEHATLRASEARLREALALASNRLHRCSVDYDTGTHEFIETGEWAAEARAALQGETK